MLATSNISGAIDAAFVDRADIKQFIGNPGIRARYEILRSCVIELQTKGLLDEVQREADADMTEGILRTCAGNSDGMSGRTLRKLPAIAQSKFGRSRFLITFLRAVLQAIAHEHSVQDTLAHS